MITDDHPTSIVKEFLPPPPLGVPRSSAVKGLPRRRSGTEGPGGFNRAKIIMRVIVSCGELRMDIPVGQGEQSMTWLALVASQRYALRKPSGQRRAREESHAVRGFFLPEEMSTEDGGVTDPNAKICDVLEDGGTVSVKVSTLYTCHNCLPMGADSRAIVFWLCS
jgi:hypothetical protein